MSLAIGVTSNQRKMRRYSGFCKATTQGDIAAQILADR
jgi:hypothetical protein